MVNPSRRQPDGSRESRIETRCEQFLVECNHHDDGNRGDDRHQRDVFRAQGGSLAEKEFVQTALVARRQTLDHGDQADSDRKKRRENEAQRGVLLEAGIPRDRGHKEGAQQARDGRTDENREGILRHVP